MPEITYNKLRTQTEKTFSEFLSGKYLPTSACQYIMAELSCGQDFDEYERIVKVVKNRLNTNNIHKHRGVLFVDFNYLKHDQEKPVLVRVLNMIYGDSYFIVVNMKEVVYLPSGCKNNQSLNELSGWLTEVGEQHLRRVTKKTAMETLLSVFKANKEKEVNLSFA